MSCRNLQEADGVTENGNDFITKELMIHKRRRDRNKWAKCDAGRANLMEWNKKRMPGVIPKEGARRGVIGALQR